MAPGNFSETARQILRLQCEGLSADEISKNLDIKLETVRYHIKQNYKKLGVNSKSRAIIMAKELGINVIAEGVERPDQTKLLDSVGCYLVQGFLYDNPMPEQDFQKRLIKRKYSE